MKDLIIKTENVEYSYKSRIGETKAVNGISVCIEKGQFIAVVGRNGSGKSTLARLLNALILPESGTVYVNGLDTTDENNVWDVRCSVGIVFQNPDNQIVGTIVEEDTAFGPENLGIDPDEIRKRVNDSLKAVGMKEYAKHSPHLLSGGQKQRISIAGILAMKPECIILDEATAMLDPGGRKEVMNVIHKLNKEHGITAIHITHHMEEAIKADRVMIVDDGKVVVDGTPQKVFSNVREIMELGLAVPQVTELFYELGKDGISLPEGILDLEQAVEEVAGFFQDDVNL